MKAAREQLKQLEDILPVPFRVVLKFGIPEHEGARGEAVVRQNAEGTAVGVIRIAAGLSVNETMEILCHEYAHLLLYGYDGFSDDAMWGLSYSDCYRVVFGKH